MGGELVAVVVIGGGEGEDRLARLADRVERLADRGEGRLAAAREDVEVERDRLHPVVLRGELEAVDDVAKPILARAAAAQQLARRGLGGLLDDRAVEVEQKRPAVAGAEGRPSRHRRVEQGEEEQHEQQDEAVLDSDEQLPDLARELHVSLSVACALG